MQGHMKITLHKKGELSHLAFLTWGDCILLILLSLRENEGLLVVYSLIHVKFYSETLPYGHLVITALFFAAWRKPPIYIFF